MATTAPLTGPAPVPLVDAIKAVASQLIVWHHLAFYGPMSELARPHAPGVLDWLAEHARVAVQAFLVVGGFLAARSLAPRLDGTLRPIVPAEVPALLGRRYARLVRPYLVALAAAIAAAWLARGLGRDPDIPSAPTLSQLVAHVLLLQDIVGVPALSAGVWYLAIDFQLHALLVLVLCAAAPAAAATGLRAAQFALLACGGLMLASLFRFNRDPALDVWAPYFFGAYGLGICAQWISTRPRKGWWTLALGLVVGAALAVEWRNRILVAGLTAAVLVWSASGAVAPRWANRAPLAFLSRISYPVFLIHYPVCLTVGALVSRLSPANTVIHALGMATAWLLSLGAGALLHRQVEAVRKPPA